ncbi:MAG TPA: glucosamine-6-phosphate deaminase [Verrucomicrobiae bacterium]|nr:glucosamine-6-phosphate deaminase [Verrucomicrobiae bacterium]
MEIIIQPNAQNAADLVAQIIAEALCFNPRLVLGLASGRTMEPVYARLVRMHHEKWLDFSACRTFNLDEYVGLPGNDRNSYRHYMNHHLFAQVNVELSNTHLPDGMVANLSGECANYERLISESGGIDLQLLGIGQNGHLGFNEPLSAFRSRTRVQTLSPMTRAQNAPLFSSSDQVPHCAITMGVGTILDCRHCVLLATGEEKAAIIAKTIEGPITSMITATALQLHPACTVVLDEAAGSQLKESNAYLRITKSASTSLNSTTNDLVAHIHDDSNGVIKEGVKKFNVC